MNLQDKIHKFIIKNKLIIVLMIFSIIISFLSESLKGDSKPNFIPRKPASFDTYIPPGLTIVPIEIANHSSLDSLIEDRGVVDLYTTDIGQGQNPGKKIASRVKIVRAPLDRQQFAIVIPDEEVSSILSHNGPYYVTIHNSKIQKPTSINKKQKPTQRVFVDYISSEN